MFARLEYAPASPFAIGKLINDDSRGLRANGDPKAGLPMEGHYFSPKIGVYTDPSEDWRASVAIGPATFIATEPDGNFYSVDATPRLTYRGWKYAHPYVEALAGVGVLEHRWVGEATKWQFSIGGGVGVLVPLYKELNLDVGYRLYHISNGSAIFGSPRPNVGYNTDMVLFGLQYGF